MASPALASLPEGSGRPSQSRSLGSVSPGISHFLPLLPRLLLPADPHPAPPSCKPGFPRFPAPQPPQEPTVGNFSRRPSAARCCPLTAGPGGSLPSPGPASCRVPPPARPAGPPLIVASPRAGLATSGCALLSSSPLHTNKKKQQPATTHPSPPPIAHFPRTRLPAPGLPAPLTARDQSASGRGGGGLGPAPRAERPHGGRALHPPPQTGCKRASGSFRPKLSQNQKTHNPIVLPPRPLQTD